jgi:DNA-binding MarR family transcriptional regulator
MDSKINHEALAADLALALGTLIRRLRSAAPTETTDLSWTQRSVLTRLEKEGPATSAELARAENVKPQSMGTVVAALEELGMIERKAHPTDGRQIVIGLTPEGREKRRLAKDAKMSWLSTAIARLPEAEQQTLLAAGEIFKRLAEQA